jgi:GNAT superfamily N-acetyltransferase
MRHEVVIRELAIDDAEAAARLSGELGYPVSAQEMRGRLQRLKCLEDRTVYVACLPTGVAGWIDVGIVHHLQAETYAEIGGLVVAGEARSKGIGRRLVARAEQWASDRGIRCVVVRSQIKREDAHRFYEREGYLRVKTSAVFSKNLPAPYEE